MELIINAGESLSSAVKVGEQKLASLWTSDSWDAADLVLMASDEEDGTYLPVCQDATGNPEYLVPFASGKRVALDAASMALATIDGWLKVKSVVVADASTPVAQTGAVTIRVGTNR